MFNNQKGQIPIIIVVMFLVIFGTAYYSTIKETKPLPLQKQTTSTPPPEPMKKVKKVAPQGTFQHTLIVNCETMERPGWSAANYIDLTKTPVLINKDLIDIDFPLPNKLQCLDASPTEKATGYIEIVLKDKWYVHIYDKNSEEGNHGGVPDLGSYGAVIKDDGNIKFTVYIPINEGGAPTGETPIVIRGEKGLKLSNGEIVFANYSTIGLDSKDSRVIDFFKDYNDPDTQSTEKSANEQVKNILFSDLANLQPSGKKAIDEIEKVLGAISVN